MNQPSACERVIRFGTFEADIVARELRKNGAKLRLQEQPFQVLVSPGKSRPSGNTGAVAPGAVARRYVRGLRQRAEHSHQQIREALGDSAEKSTIHRDFSAPGLSLHCACPSPPLKETHLPPVLPCGLSARQSFGWAGRGCAWCGGRGTVITVGFATSTFIARRS